MTVNNLVNLAGQQLRLIAPSVVRGWRAESLGFVVCHTPATSSLGPVVNKIQSLGEYRRETKWFGTHLIAHVDSTVGFTCAPSRKDDAPTFD